MSDSSNIKKRKEKKKVTASKIVYMDTRCYIAHFPFFFSGPLKIWTKGLKETIGKENFQIVLKSPLSQEKKYFVFF